MPILRMLNLSKLQAAAAGQPGTSHTLSPETKQLCLALLHGAEKYYAWSPELDETDLQTAQALAQTAIAEITIPTE